MRTLAAFIDETQADALAIAEIDPGDALAVATRFERQWAYRGGQALLWNARIEARELHDPYLPPAPLSLERRGLLRLDGAIGDEPVSLFATQFSTDRNRIRELRFARAHARAARGLAFLFVTAPFGRVGFADLGYEAVETHGTNDVREELEIAARGVHLECVRREELGAGIGAALVVRAHSLPA